MDKRKQSILKQEGRIPLQEMGLPDFPDEDTGTVTVTKSRRVSFGANFVKEFIVGSAISTQFYSEYEQAFSSSDSSNPNSSQSGLLNQSSCVNDDAINLCVKPTTEDDFIQVKKKLCLEKHQNSFNNIPEKCNDRNWDFNVSNNSNIFAEKGNILNKTENAKHITKCVKKQSHNDSFLPGEKYFQNKQNDSELSSLKFNENTEKKNKPGKFSSTICFSVDSPTADMEFTEGCISLAKSIFDKKNKEMAVYIQEKKDEKTNCGDIIIDGSEVEMSLTKCVHDQSENDSFVEKSDSCDDPLLGIQSDGSDESNEDIENVPIHMYPLNILLNRNNNSEEDSDIERSLFFPERSLTEVLNAEPLKISSCNKGSLDKDNMELSISEPLKISTSGNLSPVKDYNEKCTMELSVCEPLKVHASKDFFVNSCNNQECNVQVPNSELLRVPPSTYSSLHKDNDEECDMELSISEPLNLPVSNDLFLEKNNNEECDMELSTSGFMEMPASTDVLKENNNEERDIEPTTSELLKIPTSNCTSLDKDNSEQCYMEFSSLGHVKIPIYNDLSLEKKNNEDCHIESATSESLEIPVTNHPSVDSSNDEDYNVELSICEPSKILMTNSPPLKKNNIEELNVELTSSDSVEIPVFNSPAADKDNDEECQMELSTCEHLKVPTSNYNSLDSDSNKVCNMELTISESLKIFSNHETSKNGWKIDDKTEEVASTIEDAKQEENNEVESPSEEKKSLSCTFMHVDMDVVDEINREPEIEICASDPLSVSVCHEGDMSLSRDKNGKYVEIIDSTSLKIFSHDESLGKETYQEEEENNEMKNCSKDSSFSDVIKEAIEEVNKESLIKTSVIDLFRSSVSDTEGVSFNEDYNQKNSQSNLKMQFSLLSPVMVNDKENSEEVHKIHDDQKTINSVSEGDKKIIALLREQSQEANCCWKIESFTHNGDCRCWSFSASLLHNPVIMKFKLMPPKHMSVVSFSFILERNIELLKPRKFQSEKSKTVVDFAFEKMKNYFDPESRGLDNVHKIPLFLDRMNYFLVRINKVIDQLVRIMKEYPGSKLKKSVLSFRLHSFPLMFSLSVMVDVNDPLQLSESSVTFEKHFGNFSTNHIKSVFNDSLKSEEVLVQFIRKLVQLIVNEERLRGSVTNRSYIRLVT